MRWDAVDHCEVAHPRAYLVQVVTRGSLNRLRSLARARETYVGPWLPEPVATTPDVADDLVLAESVSLGMLVVLETLSPLERAAFVLREVFAFSYDEVAAATGRTPQACRALVSRSRRHVAARRPRNTESPERDEVTRRFLLAAATGDVAQLLDVLAPDVVLVTDGGGKRTAARRPIAGADKVARFLTGVRSAGDGAIEVRWVHANGRPTALVEVGGALDVLVALEVLGGRVSQVYLVRNPDKLGRLERPVLLTRR